MAVKHVSVLLLLLAAALPHSLYASNVIPDQDWGYVDVRTGAHMFWWLYGSSAPDRDNKPLVMWLQGGPGGSSTGFGNFEEIGPLDVELVPRNTTWIQAANVLFVDNPVGTGYSYVDNKKYLTRNVQEISKDLVSVMKAFVIKHSIFEVIPFYVFCESYGGKMTASFGVELMEAIKSGGINMNFKGVALGDGWVSPIDSVKTWGPYLYATSLINSNGLSQLKDLTEKAQDALVSGNGSRATEIWDKMESVVENLTDNVDFYNILNHNDNSETILDTDSNGVPIRRAKYIRRVHGDDLGALMNGMIKKHLNIPEKVVWGAQSGDVFVAQREDFMKDVISDVDTLLASKIKVVVYSGQLDLIVDTMGTLEWIQKLQWSSLSQFLSASRIPVYPPSGKRTRNTGAFVQHYDNMYFYWILKAGHMVPRDAGETALTMLKDVIKD